MAFLVGEGRAGAELLQCAGDQKPLCRRAWQEQKGDPGDHT